MHDISKIDFLWTWQNTFIISNCNGIGLRVYSYRQIIEYMKKSDFWFAMLKLILMEVSLCGRCLLL
jgi:hypothetical protein